MCFVEIKKATIGPGKKNKKTKNKTRIKYIFMLYIS